MKATDKKMKIIKNPTADLPQQEETIGGFLPLYTRLQACITPENQHENANDLAICLTSALTLGLNLSYLNNN
jgi:hypothetical protein